MRLTKLDPVDFTYLASDDLCLHIGEYTARGGYHASETNQQIINLKKRPNVPDAQLRWKAKAIKYWGRKVAESNLNWDVCLGSVTFVPLPCSKPAGHELHDDRMLDVLKVVARLRPGIDVRPVLYQSLEREAQHEGNRLSPDDIEFTLGIDRAHLAHPLKQTVILVDDVITRGASFSAAKSLISPLPGVVSVMGLFLAKTVHPPVNFEDYLDGDFL